MTHVLKITVDGLLRDADDLSRGAFAHALTGHQRHNLTALFDGVRLESHRVSDIGRPRRQTQCEVDLSGLGFVEQINELVDVLLDCGGHQPDSRVEPLRVGTEMASTTSAVAKSLMSLSLAVQLIAPRDCRPRQIDSVRLGHWCGQRVVTVPASVAVQLDLAFGEDVNDLATISVNVANPHAGRDG